MQTCSNDHEVIAFNSPTCPLCRLTDTNLVMERIEQSIDDILIILADRGKNLTAPEEMKEEKDDLSFPEED